MAPTTSLHLLKGKAHPIAGISANFTDVPHDCFAPRQRAKFTFLATGWGKLAQVAKAAFLPLLHLRRNAIAVNCLHTGKVDAADAIVAQKWW